jgi:steroid delta-isomerase-like uncharacterized protein
MSTEQNKAAMSRMVDEFFNKGNADAVDEFMAPDFVEHEVLPPGTPPGAEGLKQLIGMIKTAFPDFHASVDDAIAEGDKVVLNMTWSGTHKGEFMGIPPTGKHISFGVIDIIRVRDGKASEHWGIMDNMSMMQQLGAMAAPGHD